MTTLKNFKLSDGEYQQYDGVSAIRRIIELLTGAASTPMAWRTDWRSYHGDFDSVLSDLQYVQASQGNIALQMNTAVDGNSARREIRCVFVCVKGTALTKTTFHMRPDFIVKFDEIYWTAFWAVAGVTAEEFSVIQKQLVAHYKGQRCSIEVPSGAQPTPGLIVFPPSGSCQEPIEGVLIDTSGVIAGAANKWLMCEVVEGLPEVSVASTSSDKGNHTLIREPKLALPVEDNPDLFRTRLTNELHTVSGDDWLLKDVIPLRNVSMVYGPPGSLKTFLMMDIALSASQGTSWAENDAEHLSGFRPKRPLKVAYIFGEGGSGIDKRIKAWKSYHRPIHEDDVLWFPDMPKFAVASEVDKLIATIVERAHGVDIVIVDTVMRAASGLNLSIPSDTQLFMDACDRIVRELGCSVVLVHHTGKDIERGPLGAENIKAAVQCLDRVDIVSDLRTAKVVRMRQERSKDTDLRPDIFMEEVKVPIPEAGNVSSLALKRVRPPGNPSSNNDTDVQKFIDILKEHCGRNLTAMELAVLRVKSEAPYSAKHSEREIDTERKLVTNLAHVMPLSQFARRNGRGKTAPFIFHYPSALGGANSPTIS